MLTLLKFSPQEIANNLTGEFKFIAMDKNEIWWAYLTLPVCDPDGEIPQWESEPSLDETDLNFNEQVSIVFDGDWKDSLFKKEDAK